MYYARQRAKDSHKASRHKGKGKNANKGEEMSSATPTLTTTSAAVPVISAFANAGTTMHFESTGNTSLCFSDLSDPL